MSQNHQVGKIERNIWDQKITPSNNRQTGQNKMGQTKEVFITDMLNNIFIPQVWIMKMEVLVVPLTSVIDVDAGCCLITVFDYALSFYTLAIGYGYWETWPGDNRPATDWRHRGKLVWIQLQKVCSNVLLWKCQLPVFQKAHQAFTSRPSTTSWPVGKWWMIFKIYA